MKKIVVEMRRSARCGVIRFFYVMSEKMLSDE